MAGNYLTIEGPNEAVTAAVAAFALAIAPDLSTRPPHEERLKLATRPPEA
jgi:hypothetical protein